jgi:hypothetical protein
MKITQFKRRSISLDDGSYYKAKFLAQKKAVSLSALLRLFINDAFDQSSQSEMAVDLADYQKAIGTDHRLPSPHLFSTKHFRRNNML